MIELIKEYSDKYINESIKTKLGYCKKCLEEGWRNASQKQTLYEYRNDKDKIFICKSHVGCMEVGREITKNLKPMNDIERYKFKKGIDELINEGEGLIGN